MAGPLEGLRVLTFANMTAGFQASQLFADFGAEVVHIEPPGGSPVRQMASFPFLARGSKSVVLDLGLDADRDVARDLAAGADVLIESMRPGALDSMGLGYDGLRELNPGLIYASITGFGQHGPYANAPGHEGLVMAKLGGFFAVSAMTRREGPAFLSVPYGAYTAAQTALHGILAALHERQTSGLGQRVDASFAQGIAGLATWNWFLRVITEKYPGAFNAAPSFSANDVPQSPMIFMLLIGLTSDGRWLQFSQVQPRLFVAMLKALGLSWVLTDPEWAGAPVFPDESKRLAFWELLLDACRQKSLAEWQQIFEDDHDVWAETMRRGSELLDHPQMVHNDSVVTVVDAERGAVRMPGPLAALSATPADVTRSAPMLDEHGAVCRSLLWPMRSLDSHGISAGSGPLAGVTVIDLGTFFAAPFGTAIFADLGARVIKVEPLDGEPMRNIVPFPEVGAAKSMQGKRSIGVDLNTDEGRAILYRLVANADIVMQSFRAGVAQRQGVDEATLRAINPALIYLNAPGYGVDGPCGNRPAYAPTIGAGAGFVMRNLGTVVPERADLSMDEIREYAMRLNAAGTTEFAQADGVAAMAVATAMALALVIRDRTGVSQGMMTTMLNSAAHLLCDDSTVWASTGEAGRADDQLLGYHALYRLYQAADDWVFLAAPIPASWSKLCAALAAQVDLASDDQFATYESRRSNDGALASALEAVFASQPAQYWEDLLLSHDVGCVVAEVGPPEKVLQSEEFGRASGYLADVEHPTFEKHVRLAPLVTLSRTPGVALPGCLLGQHTHEILAELGMSAHEIADLEARKIVCS